MEMLGRRNGGVIIIRTNTVMLPHGSDVMEFDVNQFGTDDVQTLLDSPTSKCYALMVSDKGVVDGKVKDIALLMKLSATRIVGASTLQANTVGIKRVQILKTHEVNKRLYASDLRDVEIQNNKPDEVKKMAKDIIEAFKQSKSAEAEAFVQELSSLDDMSHFADFACYNLIFEEEIFRRLLNTTSVYIRMKEAHMTVHPEKYEKKETTTVKIKSYNEDVQKLIDRYYEVLPHMGERAQKEVFTALKSLSKMATNASDYAPFLRFAELAVHLPYSESTKDASIEEVEKKVDKSHYGMEKAKERILEYIAIRKLNPDARGTVLLLDGPPGTGKTTLAQEVAKAMGRKCERISMGGCHDASFIKGHSRTYTGAQQGRIVSAMKSAGVVNPIIILDEVEKINAGGNGDPAAAMLELLDPNQNTTFTDTYLGFGIDLSKVLFICTSNNMYEIPEATLDRMEAIELDGYDLREKMKIATDYVVPKKAKELGVKGTRISKAVLKMLIEGYTREAGVRTLEKNVDSLFRKVAIEKAKGKNCKINKKLVEKRLGLPYIEDKPMEHNIPGVVSGLYYSAAGGGVLDIEAVVVNHEGNGQLIVTGMTGDVMNESISLVRSYVCANAHKFGIDGTALLDMDIHIHMPDGSTPKDGPSAGAAYALLFMSLLTDTPVKAGLCLTGEATLTGRYNPIGGVDQKCAGAVRTGMKTVILPKANYRDYVKLPKEIKDGAEYHFCTTIEEVIRLSFDWDVINAKIEELEAQMKAMEDEEEETVEATL